MALQWRHPAPDLQATPCSSATSRWGAGGGEEGGEKQLIRASPVREAAEALSGGGRQQVRDDLLVAGMLAGADLEGL
jgi:hypothetical protein